MASLAELTVSIVGDVSNVRKAFDELGKGVDNVGTSLTTLGNDMKSMGTSMSLYVTAPLVAIGAGMSKMAMDFESEMLKVQAVTGGTGEEISALSDLALKLGADTVFSASDAAGAFYYLAAAGYDVNQITAAAADTMNLAAAGEMDMASAANILTNILAGYGLGADAAAHVTNVLAQSAADTKAEVEPMGVAFSYIGPLAKEMGWSIEETAAVLGEFSLRGYEGERAGAGLVTAMTALLDPTDDATKILAKYGLSVEDVNPKTHSFAQIIDTLNGVTMETGDTMAIFGNRSGPQMLAAMSMGTEGIVKQTTALQSCDGAAQKMADTMTSGARGGLEDFKGSIETLAISMGTLINEYLDPILVILAKVADAFNMLPGPVKMLVLLLAGLAISIGPVLLVAGTLISSIGTITTAIAGAGGLSAVLTTVVGILTGPVAIAIAAFAAAAYIVYQNWDTIGPMLQRTFNTIVEAIRPTATAIQDFVERTLASLSAWWNENGPAISMAADRVGSALMILGGIMYTVFTEARSVILEFTSGPLVLLWEAFKVAVDLIIPILEYLVSQIAQTFMLIVNLINGDFSAAWENLKNIFSNNIDAIISLAGLIPAAFKLIWDNILAAASYALDLLILIVTGKTGEAASAIKAGIVDAGLEMVESMVGWIPGVSGVVDGMRDELLRVPSEANTAMSQFGPVVAGQINAGAIQALAASGALVDGTVNEIATLPGAAAIEMNSFSPAIVGPINATASPASSAASAVGSGVTNSLSSALIPMQSNTTTAMSRVTSAISGAGSSMYSAAASVGQQAVNGFGSKIAELQNLSNQIAGIFRTTASQAASIKSSFDSATYYAGNMPSSGHGGSSSSTGSTGIKRQGKDGTGEDKVKIREAHATGGIAGYTGWHWMERGELAIPQQTNWDKLLVQPIVKALSGGSSGSVSAGNVIIQNMPVTLTKGYDIEQLMYDLDRIRTQKRIQLGVSL